MTTVMLCGCGGRGTVRTLDAPEFDPQAAAAAALASFDTDGSGDLSAAEIEACPGLESAAVRIDTNGDTTLARAEIEARFGLYRSAARSIVPMRYRVVLDGRPLSGAVVSLTPESFMGPGYAVCTGTTGDSGDVVISAEAVRQRGYAGVYPGIYRTTVVPAGAAGQRQLPHAKGGAADLGQEVAPDIPELERAVPLPMTSRRPTSAAR